MRATKVVILDVLDEHTPQMPFIPQEQPMIQALLAYSSYPALSKGVGVRSMARGVKNLDALRGENRIKRVCEFRVMVVNEIADGQARIVEFPEQPLSLLGHPRRIRSGRTTSEIQAAR